MSDPMIIAAAAVLVISAVAAAAVSIIGAFGKMKGELLNKVTDVEHKADTIVHLTDGSATAAVAHRAVLDGKITSLHDQLLTLQTQRVADARQDVKDAKDDAKERIENPPRPDPSPERGG